MKKTRKILAAVSAAALSLSMFTLSFSVNAEIIPAPFPELEKSTVRYMVNSDNSKVIILYNDGSTTTEYNLNSNGWGTCYTYDNDTLYYVTARITDKSRLPEYIRYKDAPMSSDPNVFCLYTDNACMSKDKAQQLIKTLDDEAIGSVGISDVEVYVHNDVNKCFILDNTYTVLGNYKYNEADFRELVKKGYTVTKGSDKSYTSSFEITIDPPGFDKLSAGEKIPEAYKTMLDVMKTELPKGVGLKPMILSTLLEGYQKADIFADEYGYENMDIAYEYKFGDSDVYTVKGDISGDGKIDLYDAIKIAEYIAGKIQLSDEDYNTADFNSDGKVDIYDAIDIAKILIL